MQSNPSDPDQLQTLTTFGKKAFQLVSKTLEDVQDRIVFQSNARDTYFKKAAQRKAAAEYIWLENPIAASYFYTIKWDFGDQNFDYSKQKAH